VNLVVGTTNNNAPISLSIKKAAKSVIQKGEEITDGMLNMIEMAFRSYDPCMSCATHSLPGQMPLVLTIHNAEGNVVERVSRNV
jgi:F420-non-reducing hydrogenase large subunit